MPQIRVEPYDAPPAKALIGALSAEIQERYGPEQYAAVDPAVFAPPGGVFLVASVGGEAAGCGGFRRIDDGVAEVHRMYVAPAHRRAGVARALLAELEEHARRAAYTQMRLETGTLQPEAIALYRSAGWDRIPCFFPYVVYDNSVCFSKRL